MRLIDADALLQDNTWEWYDDWGNHTMAGQAIAVAPTIDAVEVVRCKDCRWNEVCCRNIRTEGRRSDDYCSCGERREDGEA